MKEKDLIMDFSRLQAEASPETSQKSYCDEETSKATEKEDRDLLSVIYKNAVDSRRAAWHVITSIEQKEKSKSEEQLASYAREYIAKVENELQKIREGVLALTDKKFVASPSTNESKAFYHKMKSDYYRYFAEFATGETKSKAGEDAWDACVEANKIAENELVLSSVVAQRQSHMIQTVQMPMETPQLPCNDKVVDVPVATQQEVHVPQERVVEKIVEIPQLQIVGEIVRDTQTSDSLGMAPVRQGVQAEIGEVVEIEVPIPAESASLMSVQRVQKTVGVPQIQFIDKLVDSHVNMRSVPEVEHVVPSSVTADVSAGVKSDITWTKELAEIRQMVEFLVRRERKLDAKTTWRSEVGALGKGTGRTRRS